MTQTVERLEEGVKWKSVQSLSQSLIGVSQRETDETSITEMAL